MKQKANDSTLRQGRRDFLALVASGAAATSLAAAEAKNPISLFNGQDLDGWVVADGPESAFYVDDHAIVASPSSTYPTWLRSAREYENFDLTLEFFLKGWIDGGVYLHAPEHGRASDCGIKVNIFHQKDETPKLNSMGAIFPLIAPKRADLHKTGEWNTLRILHDWPNLKVWVNGEIVQDLSLDLNTELSRRLRKGFLGIVAIGYPLRVRNVQVRELPSKLSWTTLFNGPQDMEKWFISESNKRTPARFDPYGHVLRGDGVGHIATKELYQDFELQLYIRGARQHNGGVLFRSAGKGLEDKRRYEIQLHDVAEAHYPTGSLYYYKRSKYPRIEEEKWFLFQLSAKGKSCWVRIDGETVLEYDELQDLAPGHIELQAHQNGRWLEFKDVKIRKI